MTPTPPPSASAIAHFKPPLCGWHGVGAPNISDEEKDPKQAAVKHGQ